LKKKEIKITDGAILSIIQDYTREAGVRNLEREISKLCRKVVKSIIMKKTRKQIQITRRNIEKYLGVKRFRFGLAEEHNLVGQVTGLAWTEVGGELLTIEAQAVPGKGNTIQTGRLGDVMQESIRAAMTVVRSRAEMFGVEGDYFQEHDFHVHVPEGATPKDGPSAGIAMVTALVSAVTRIPVRADVAMTGEITLRGKVLPIGGLKEKLLAAVRGGIKTVLIPAENKKDLKEIQHEVINTLQIHSVEWIDEVLRFALTSMPEPLVKVGAPPVIEKEKKRRSQQERTH
jgi:ATP-dependent Lon protease